MEGLFADKYRIPSNRLIGYDYTSSGFYFITICTHNRVENLGDVAMDDNHEWSVALSDMGKITRDELLKTPQIRRNVALDEWVIMPNHVHVIFVLRESKYGGFVETQRAASLQGEPIASLQDKKPSNTFYRLQPESLPVIVRSFKSAVTNQCHKQNFDFHWQSRYYDHIIRNEIALNKIRQYIRNNPRMWYRDRNRPEGILM